MASAMWKKIKKALSLKRFSSDDSAASSSSAPMASSSNPAAANRNARSSGVSSPRRSGVVASDPRPRHRSALSSSSSFSSALSSSLSSLSRTLSMQHSVKTCAICLGSLKKRNGEAIFHAECSHQFHFKCITESVNHGNLLCPVCRCKWKDLPFQRSNFQLNNSGRRSQVNPHNSPLIQHEPQQFSDDEALPRTHAGPVLPSQPQSLVVESFTEFPAVSASDSLSKFAVLLRIRAPPLDDTCRQHRAPIDLVTVLDVSGSMQGKLDLLKSAVSFIIENMGPLDRLSIVTFSNDARRVLPLRRMTDSGLEDAMREVDFLSARGGTNIVEGLKKGVRVLEERRECNPVASIILLSDGHHSQHGSTNQRPSKRLEYLKQLPASIFPNNWQNENENEQRSRRPSFSVHTFGFGIDHDSASMHAISDASGGTFSFIESFDILQDAFARCIGGLLSVVAQDVRLDIRSASPGIEIGSVASGRYKSEIFYQGHQAVIDIGNLYAEEQKEFMVYLSIPGSSAIDGEDRHENTPLLDVSCSQRDLISSDVAVTEGDRVVIRRPHVLSAADQVVCLEVDRQRNRLWVTETIADAQSMAEMGDLKGAQALLEKSRSTLLSTASTQAGDHLCNMLEAELREIQNRMETAELYQSSGRAYILSGMSSHLMQRATTRGHTTALTLGTGVVGGNIDMTATTSYETPSMVNMVNKSQTQTFSSGELPQRLNKSCSLVGYRR